MVAKRATSMLGAAHSALLHSASTTVHSVSPTAHSRIVPFMGIPVLWV